MREIGLIMEGCQKVVLLHNELGDDGILSHIC
jgi:hypothetical protein